jgi:hypothetical protein
MSSREFGMSLEQGSVANTRPSRFAERPSAIRFMEQNLDVLESHNDREIRSPTPIVHNKSYLDPRLHAPPHPIRRRPYSHAAQKPVQVVSKRALNRDSGVMLSPLPAHYRPEMPRKDVHFENFVPEHQLKTWRELDREAWHGLQAQSLCSIISHGVNAVKNLVGKMMGYTRL